jgi:NAD-dependent dihydropyrimidine dehydrogenase PreA subunit
MILAVALHSTIPNALSRKGVRAMTQTSERPKPFLFPEFCKGCGRCIEACPKHCITLGTAIHPATGLTPVHLELEQCNGCGLCLSACPEPYGLAATPALQAGADYELQDPAQLFGVRPHAAARADVLPGCQRQRRPDENPCPARTSGVYY